MENLRLNHENISPTAKLVAYYRQFCDIEYSKDVAKILNVNETMETIFKGLIQSFPKTDLLVPFMELRYKCIENYIKKNNFTQVLEFASGISLRGLSMTKDPNMVYVETDLLGINNEKKNIINYIIDKNKEKKRDNLFFYSINVLNCNEIEQSLERFNINKPLLLVHEGLFQYLTKEEKKQAALNFKKVLSKFKGAWLTPDLDTERSERIMPLFNKERFKEFTSIIENLTGRNFEQNAFKSQEDVKSFFKEIGFDVEINPQYDKDIKLSSLKDNELIIEALNMLNLFSMRLLPV